MSSRKKPKMDFITGRDTVFTKSMQSRVDVCIQCTAIILRLIDPGLHKNEPQRGAPPATRGTKGRDEGEGQTISFSVVYRNVAKANTVFSSKPGTF